MLDFIKYIYPWMLGIILSIIIFLITINWRILCPHLSKIKKKIWVIILLIFLFSLFVRTTIIPHEPFVFFDEFTHINIAKQLESNGEFCRCTIRDKTNCLSCSVYDWPGGYHILLSMMFKVFGNDINTAFFMNSIVGSLSIIILFLYLSLLSENLKIKKWEQPMLVSVFVFSMIPLNLKFSGTGALGPLSIFFILLSLFSAEIFIREKSLDSFILFLSILLYTANIRPENFLLIFFFLLYILSRKSIKKLFTEKKYVLLTIIFFILMIPQFFLLYHGINNVATEDWGEPLSLKVNNFQKNIFSNLLFFFDINYNSIILTLFSLLGIIILFKRNKKLSASMVFLFIIFIIFYSSFKLGNFRETLDSFRYSMVLYIPMIIFFFFGTNYIIEKKFIKPNISVLLIILLFLSSIYPCFSLIKSRNFHYDEYKFIEDIKDDLPNNIYILTYSSDMMIAITDKSIISLETYFTERNAILSQDELILFSDYWKYNRPEWDEIEIDLRKNYDSKQLAELALIDHPLYGNSLVFYSIDKLEKS